MPKSRKRKGRKSPYYTQVVPNIEVVGLDKDGNPVREHRGGFNKIKHSRRVFNAESLAPVKAVIQLPEVKATAPTEEEIRKVVEGVRTPSVQWYPDDTCEIDSGSGPRIFTNKAGYDKFEEALKKEAAKYTNKEGV